LAKELNEYSLRFFDGVGQHPAGDWPAEPSYFALGLSREAGRAQKPSATFFGENVAW